MKSEPQHTLAEVIARHPGMFDQTDGISIALGWINLFAQLCAEIEASLGENRRRFRWIQTNEKFGSACFYWKFGKYKPPLTINLIASNEIVVFKASSVSRRKASGSDESLMKCVGELVNAAEQKSRKICIACGSQENIESTGSGMLAMCPEHARQFKAGMLSNFWCECVDYS